MSCWIKRVGGLFSRKSQPQKDKARNCSKVVLGVLELETRVVPAAVITSISPDQGAQGGGVLITINASTTSGTGFGTKQSDVAAVNFSNGTNTFGTATLQSWSTDQITLYTPPLPGGDPLAAYTVDVIVNGADSTAATTGSDQFTYTVQPTFTGGLVNITDNTGPLPNGGQLYVLLYGNSQYYTIHSDGSTTVAGGSATPTALATLPIVNGQYQLTLPLPLVSGRLYFTTNLSLTTAPPIIGPNDYYYDFVEPDLTSASLNVDTSQVDQFGMPITIQVTPNDSVFTNGSGINTGLSQASIFQQYQADMTGSFSAFLDDYIPSAASQTPQILAPQHVINNQFSAAQQPAGSTVVVVPSGGTSGDWEATLTLTGWINTPFAVGSFVSGPNMPAGTTVVSTTGSNQVTVKSSSTSSANPFASATIAPATNGTGLNVVAPPTGGFSGLASWFGPTWGSTASLNTGNSIDAFFNYYKTNSLYLEDNGGPNGTVLYTGKVTQISADNFEGSSSTYTVLQFTYGTGGSEEVYNIYYPYFTTNSPVGKKDPYGIDIPPPPSYFTLPNLTNYDSPSQMIFGASGVFADNAFQPAYTAGTSWGYKGTSTALADLERDVAAALTRGYGTTLIATGDTSMLPTFQFTSGSTTQGTWTLSSPADESLGPLLEQGMYVDSFRLLNYPMQISAAPIKNGDGTWSIAVTSINGPLVQPAADNLMFFNLYEKGQTYNAYSAFFQSRGDFTAGIGGIPINLNGRAYGDAFSDYMNFSSDLNSLPNPAGAATQTAVLSITLDPWSGVSLDVDGDGKVQPLTDGILILRYLFGFTGSTLTQGALGPGATRTDARAIIAFLDQGKTSMLEVDGVGPPKPLTDGILTLRYLFGFSGTTLTSGSLDPGATRTDPAVIQAFLDGYNPNTGHLWATETGPGAGSGGELNANELQKITSAAIARWEATDLSSVARSRVESAQVQVADLGGTSLGETHGNNVLIDRDAAGYGWFVDPTPLNDSEFTVVSGITELQASLSSPASGRMDLLTVVMHELGLVMGLPEFNRDVMPYSLMTDVLGAGIRSLPPS